tara:strand:- start:1824 stop:2294 length:471 start_codon:yes stop_codon:yes gene_type:complete
MRNQDIHKIPRNIFKKAGELAKSRILEDASKGIFQNEKKNLRYKSKSYRKYKSKGMVGSKGKLKGFENTGIDTTTKFVNMNLTGETTRRISVKNISDGFKLVFARGQIVEGNANRHGYDIFDLNKKNLKRLFRFFETRIEKNIKEYTSKPVNIRIG